MKKELNFFKVDNDYGFNQDRFSNLMMKMGGCAAVTACDSFIYFKKYKGLEKPYPYDTKAITKKDYTDFSNTIKPYLHPRMSGIDTLDIYIDGINDYLKDINETRLSISGFSADESMDKAKDFIISQIDNGYPVPCLILKHKSPLMKDFTWHWFLITGYNTFENTTMVKVVTYGIYQWFDLGTIWDTGYERKGGLIKFDIKSKT